MRNKYIENFEKAQVAEKTIPDFRAGDTLRLAVTIKEGDKSRIQAYEGVCIAKRGQGTGETVTVRKIGANGVGIYSDSISEIKVIRRGRVRRAKLFYLRELTGKKARIKELRRK